MALRDCIDQFITDKEVRESLLNITDDAKLQSEFTRYANEAKRNLTVNKVTAGKLKKIKDRLELSGETEGYTPYNAAMDEITLGTVRGEMRGGASLEDEVFGIKGELYMEMGDLVDGTKSDAFGKSRNTDPQKDVVRQLFSQKTEGFRPSKQVKKYADQLTAGLEKARVMLNDALGEVDIVKHFTDYLPNFDDVKLFTPNNFGKWFTDVQNYADVDRIISTIYDKDGILEGMTRSQKLSTELVEGAFRKIYEAKGSGGLKKLDYGRKSKTNIPSRYTHDRVIVFENGDNWLKYHEAWGNKDMDIMNAVHGAFEGYARDIAAIRKFGHDPEAGVREMLDHAGKTSYEVGEGVVQTKADDVMGAYNHLMGNMHSSGTTAAKVIAGLRQLQTLKLGGATITAVIGDSFTAAVAGNYSGLSVMRMAMDMVGNLASYKSTLKDAANMGLNAEYAVGHARQSNRFFEASGWDSANRIGNFMTRVTGLNMWTMMSKITYQREILQSLAQRANMDYFKVNKETTDLLRRHGISEGDWNKIRKAVKDNNGSLMLDPREMDFEMRQKTLTMLSSDTRMAIMEPNAQAKQMAYGESKSGTVAGETRRALLQFKMHGLSFMYTSISRGLFAKNLNKMAYLGVNIAGLTMAGAVMIVAQDATRGKTWRKDIDPFENPKFLLEAMLKGGSLGLVGDLFAQMGVYRGLESAVAGPAISDVSRLGTYLFSTLKDLKNFEAKRLGAEVTSAIVEKSVGNIWYARIVINKLQNQGLRQIADPQHNRKQREKTRTMKKEKGQEYWINPR